MRRFVFTARMKFSVLLQSFFCFALKLFRARIGYSGFAYLCTIFHETYWLYFSTVPQLSFQQNVSGVPCPYPRLHEALGSLSVAD